jgi:protocatechuate 3,4-dioxygenase, beta subunit
MLKPTPQIHDSHDHIEAPNASPAIALTRRQVLSASGVLAGTGLVSAMSATFAQTSLHQPTAAQTRGPFYPLSLPADLDADLTQINGRPTRALGTIVYLNGRLINVRGEPVADAELHIWQANAAGRYDHPSDRNPMPLDPNFQGFARIRTASDGTYRIKTIKPGAYAAGAYWMRPPHIHVEIRSPAGRLTTQMYFEGEALNDKDQLFQSVARKEAVIARYIAKGAGQEPDALAASWNIVLAG